MTTLGIESSRSRTTREELGRLAKFVLYAGRFGDERSRDAGIPVSFFVEPSRVQSTADIVRVSLAFDLVHS